MGGGGIAPEMPQLMRDFGINYGISWAITLPRVSNSTKLEKSGKNKIECFFTPNVHAISTHFLVAWRIFLPVRSGRSAGRTRDGTDYLAILGTPEEKGVSH